MNKKLLPLIVVLALASIAVAGDMEYKLYGKLHMSTQMNNDSENSQIALSSNTSRFGVKGSQELADEYHLIWQFEQSLDLANRGGTLAFRNSYMGMKGNWGSWLIGIHDTPMKNLGRKATFFFDTVGDFRTTTMGWDARYSDVFMYMTPKMDAFMGQLMYRYDQNDAGADEAASVLSAMAAYNKDGIFLGAAFETNTAGNYPGDWDDDPSTADTYGEAASAIRVAGKYTAEQFGLSGLFQTVSNAEGVDGLSQQTFGGEVLYKASDKYHVKANYYMTDPNTDVDDDEFSQVAFGIDRVYSKSVTVYVQFAMMMNGDNSAVGLGREGEGINGWGGPNDGVAPFAAGESPWSASVGLWKTF